MLTARINKILFAIITLFIFFLHSSSAVNAQTNKNPNVNSDVPSSSHYRAQVILYDITSAIMCQLIGIDFVNPAQTCLGIDNETNKIGFIKNDSHLPLNGALGSLVGMITMTYDIPIRTGDYINYLSSGFGIIKPAYAQSTGFENLTALMNLWKKVRDLTYTGFVLIFVLIGIGVMLRVKLDPRTVMTLENQIPKVVIYIMLITFSYAIVGLAIDMMWVTTYTGINIISGDTLCEDGGTLAAKGTSLVLDNPLHYVNNTLGCPWGANKTTTLELGWNVGRSIGEIVSRMLLSVFGIDPGSLDGKCSIVFNGIVTCAKRAINSFIANIIGALVALVIVIAILVQLGRVWLMLIKSYIYILLYTILGPIWIIAGLLPNNTNFGFTQWMRRIIFSLSLYPLTIFLFLLAVALVSDPSINQPNVSGGAFVPPLVANPTLSNNMGYILALGVILITPEVINMAREMFKVSPSKYAPAAFAALGAGAAITKSVGGPIFGRRKDGSWQAGSYYARRAVRGIPGINKITEKWDNLKVNDKDLNPGFYKTPVVATGNNTGPGTAGGGTAPATGATQTLTTPPPTTTQETDTDTTGTPPEGTPPPTA